MKGSTVSVYLDARTFALFEALFKGSKHKTHSAFLKDIITNYVLQEDAFDPMLERVASATAISREGVASILEQVLLSAKLTERIGQRLVGSDEAQKMRDEVWEEVQDELRSGAYFLKD